MAALSLDLRVILCWIRAVSFLEPQFYRACQYSPVFFPTTPSQLRLSHPWNLLGHHNLLLNKGVNLSGLMQCVSHQEHNHSRRLMHTNEIPTLTFSSHSVEDPCNEITFPLLVNLCALNKILNIYGIVEAFPK